MLDAGANYVVRSARDFGCHTPCAAEAWQVKTRVTQWPDPGAPSGLEPIAHWFAIHAALASY
jgi:hypothetical protein